MSKLARKHVTVSLSGDGGDELFCGYQRYMQGKKMWSVLGKAPHALKISAAKTMEMFPSNTAEKLMSLMPKDLRISNFSDRLPKFAEVMKVKNRTEFYRRLVSHWKHPADVVIGGIEHETIFNNGAIPNFKQFENEMMFIDSKTYLPDDILTKLDRSTMSVSLEGRVPLLDHKLVEFAWRLPLQYKLRNGTGKYLLKKVLTRYIPTELVDRPKMGFGVPIESWLRGPLKDWAESLLDKEKMENQGYLHIEPIHKMWKEHSTGERRWHYYLWDVLMFQAWLEAQ